MNMTPEEIRCFYRWELIVLAPNQYWNSEWFDGKLLELSKEMGE